jgi:hypothetical protein
MARLYRFGEEEYKPDTQCYYVLIKAIGQTPSIKNGPVQAEELLYEMMEAFQDGNDALRPNRGPLLMLTIPFEHQMIGLPVPWSKSSWSCKRE